jgi:cation transport protein ChaC
VALVEDFTQGALAGPLTAQTLAVWREAANARAAKEAGFVYDGYVRLKIGGVIEFVSHLIAESCGFPEESNSATRVRHAVAAWARMSGAYPADGAIPLAGNVTSSTPPAWVRFALRFDLAFRQRRLRFLLRGLNQLYARLDTPDCPGLVFALLQGGSCRGVAYRIARAQADEALERLWLREMPTGVYDPRWLPCITEDGPVQALAFTLSRRSPNYTGELQAERLRHIFAHARGRYGTTLDYAQQTYECLRQAGIQDHLLQRMLRHA